jgi:hypothetical protein
MSDDELRHHAKIMIAFLDGRERMSDVDRHHLASARRLLELLPPSDSNEPVTAEWLKAVGFLNEDADEPTFWTVLHNDLNPAFTIDVDEKYGSSGFIGEAEDYIHWPHDIVSRAQVRDICRALGIQLTEPA